MANEEQRDGWITALRVVESELNGDDTHFELTNPHVIEAFVRYLITALKMNAAFRLNLSDEQLATIQQNSTHQEAEIQAYIRNYLESERARVMLSELG